MALLNLNPVQQAKVDAQARVFYEDILEQVRDNEVLELAGELSADLHDTEDEANDDLEFSTYVQLEVLVALGRQLIKLADD